MVGELIEFVLKQLKSLKECSHNKGIVNPLSCKSRPYNTCNLCVHNPLLQYSLYNAPDYIHPRSRIDTRAGASPQIVLRHPRSSIDTRVGGIFPWVLPIPLRQNRVLCMHVNTNLVFKLSKFSVTSMYNAIKYNANRINVVKYQCNQV